MNEQMVHPIVTVFYYPSCNNKNSLKKLTGLRIIASGDGPVRGAGVVPCPIATGCSSLAVGVDST